MPTNPEWDVTFHSRVELINSILNFASGDSAWWALCRDGLYANRRAGSALSGSQSSFKYGTRTSQPEGHKNHEIINNVDWLRRKRMNRTCYLAWIQALSLSPVSSMLHIRSRAMGPSIQWNIHNIDCAHSLSPHFIHFARLRDHDFQLAWADCLLHW